MLKDLHLFRFFLVRVPVWQLQGVWSYVMMSQLRGLLSARTCVAISMVWRKTPMQSREAESFGEKWGRTCTHTHTAECVWLGISKCPAFLNGWLYDGQLPSRPVAIYPFKPTIHGSFSLRKHGFLPYLSSLTPGYIQGSGNCGKPGQKASGGGARKTREAVKFTQGVSFCWHTRHDRYFSGCCQQNSGLCWIYVDMLSWWPWWQYIWPRVFGMAGMVYATGRASQWMQIGGFQREAGCHWG